MNDRKALRKLLERFGLPWDPKELPDGRTAVEVKGATFFFKGKKFVGGTSKAAARRWTRTRKAQSNGAEHG